MAGSDLAELRALVEADTAGFMRGMDNVDRRMGKTQGAMHAMGRAGGDMARTVGKGALLLGGGMLLAGGFIGKAGLSMAMLKQNAQIAFTTMLGSGQKATKMMNDLQKFASTTPFEFKELIPATQRLLAFGFQAKNIIPMMTDIGDAAAGLGLGTEGVNRISLALGQMSTRGHVAGGELMQLNEAGINATKYLSEAFHKPTSDIQDMVQKGLIPADKGIQAILKGMRQDFGGLMEKQNKTLSGQLSNLADNFNNVAGNIAMKFVPSLTHAADSMNKWLSSKSGQQFMQSLVDGAGAAMDKIASVIHFVTSHWGQIKSVAASVFNGVQSVVSKAMSVIGPLVVAGVSAIATHWDQIKQGATDAFNTASGAVQQFASYLQEIGAVGLAQALAGQIVPALTTMGGVLTGTVLPAVQSLFGFISAHQGTFEALAAGVAAYSAALLIMSGIQTAATAITTAYAAAVGLLDAAMDANPIVIAIAAMAALAVGLVVLYKRNEAFRNAVQAAWSTIKGVVVGAVNVIRTVIGGLAGAFSAVSGAVRGAWNGITGAVRGAVSGIVSVVGGLGGKILSAIQKAFRIAWDPGPTLRTLGTKAVSAIISGMSSLGSKAWTAIKQAFSGISGAIHFGVHFTFGSQTFGLGPLPDITVPYPNGISFGANGGVFGGSGGMALIGEAGREFAIPVTRNRQGALNLWAQAGKELGVPGLANGGVAGVPPGDPGVTTPFNPRKWSRHHTLASLYQLESDYEANTRRWSSYYQRSGGVLDAGENRALAGRIGVTQQMLVELRRVRGVDQGKMNAARKILRRRQATLRAAQKAAGAKGLSKAAQKARDAAVKRAQRGVDAAQKRVDYWSGQLGAGSDTHGLIQQGYDLAQDQAGYLNDAANYVPPAPPDTGGGTDTGGAATSVDSIDAGAGVFSGSSSVGGGGISGGGGGGGGITYISIDMRGAVVTVDDFVSQVREKLAAYGKVNGSIFGNVQADTVPR